MAKHPNRHPTLSTHLRRLTIIGILLFGLGMLPSISSYAQDDSPGAPILFPETGHTLAYSFREFYERYGGTALFGMPLTEVFLENNRPVQYFEHARLEWHGEFARVQVGALGRWAMVQEEEHTTAFEWLSFSPDSLLNSVVYPDGFPSTTMPERVLFPQTGHTLLEPFLTFWYTYGALPIFGYPISESYEQTTPNGQTYRVQYFERMRMEYYPDQATVQLAPLGQDYLITHPAPTWATHQVMTAASAWDGVRPTAIRIPSVGINSKITAAGYKGEEWDVPRFSIAHYWALAGYPFSHGNIVLAGHSGYPNELFDSLPNVQVGADVIIAVGDTERHYTVSEIHTVLPSETWVMNPTPTETLTLITCVPVKVYTHRLIVRALPMTPLIDTKETEETLDNTVATPITSTVEFIPIMLPTTPLLVQESPVTVDVPTPLAPLEPTSDVLVLPTRPTVPAVQELVPLISP